MRDFSARWASAPRRMRRRCTNESTVPRAMGRYPNRTALNRHIRLSTTETTSNEHDDAKEAIGWYTKGCYSGERRATECPLFKF